MSKGQGVQVAGHGKKSAKKSHFIDMTHNMNEMEPIKFPQIDLKKMSKKEVIHAFTQNMTLLIKLLSEYRKDVLSVKRVMKAEIEKRFIEKNKDLIHQAESATDGIVAIRTLFKKKGYITQEEYNDEKAEMRKRKR